LEYLVELCGFDSTKAWTDLFFVQTWEQRKAKLNNVKRDLELKKSRRIELKVKIDLNYLEPKYVLVGG
jgi:hypothetical protein